MPTYDYVCEACQHELELFQSITEAAKRKCPKCGKLRLKRLIGGGSGILFKGSGFYQTDYRSSSYKKDAEADRTSKAPGSSPKTSESSSKTPESSSKKSEPSKD